MFVLHDANNNLVALTDLVGQVLEQYTYEPYGALVHAESLLPHPVNKLGHQGLFFDHFEAQADGRILVPGATGLYFNRNRHYSPTLGRFLQRDPNATAQPLLMALARNAVALSVDAAIADVRALYGDGMNLYAYLGGNPIGRRDPRGLWDDYEDAMADRLVQLGFMAEQVNSAIGVAFDWFAYLVRAVASFVPVADTAFAGYDYFTGSGTIGGVAFAASTEFTGPASDFARVGGKLLAKANRIRVKILARGGKPLKAGYEYLEHVGKTGSYKEMRALTRGHGGAIHAHHLLEARHARNWEVPDTDDIPAIILMMKDHQALSSELASKLPLGVTHTKQEVWDVYQEVYGGYPEALDLIRKYFNEASN